jgi:mRNA interferase MazF
MKKGKIVLTRFPFTNLSSDKRRPALILIDTEASDPDTIVAFISSVIPESLSASDLLLHEDHPDFERTGLIKNSIVKLDKLATLDKSIFTGEMGSLSSSLFIEAQEKLKCALQLENGEGKGFIEA